MNIKKHSKSGIFLIELLIIIAVFAVCSAICVKVLVTARAELSYSERLTSATNIAGDIAERFKAGEDPDSIVESYTADYDGTVFVKSSASALLPPQEDNALIAVLEQHSENGIAYLDVTVSDRDYEYISITAAKLGG